jgi:hypothetical protein
MSKLLTITVRVNSDELAADAALYDCDELINLLTGISGGQVDGRVLSAYTSEEAGLEDSPIVAEVVGDGVERAYTHIATVGDLRRFIDGLPDSAGLESYSGSVESLVNFGLSYGRSCNDWREDDAPAESFVLTINNEN